ncbi:MAG: sodium:calcium antiporter [Candidatus Omnitrophica bacterium]|nr:sodium:calcium antiporter [Candidatus Omnitrophota bacterium]
MIWSLNISVAVFALCIGVIGFSGYRLTAVADRLADITGLGEAIMGAVFIGIITSLSGSILSLTAAWDGHGAFAVSNAAGGIGLQLTFLAFADMTYSKANLEHAAASQVNLMQGVLLMILLALPLLAVHSPAFSIGCAHPITFASFIFYGCGLSIIARSRKTPMWKPLSTKETVTDKPTRKRRSKKELTRLWLQLLTLAPIVGVSGWALGQSGISIVRHSHLSTTLVGGLFTAGITSVPELVIAIAAVKRNALTLAVGNIIGGNTFDTLIISGSDLAYRNGSIYNAIGDDQIFLISLTLLLTGIWLMGLLKREKHGIANIGLESFLILLLYSAGFTALLLNPNS